MNSLEYDLIKIHTDMMKSEYYMVDFFWTRAKEEVEKAPAEEFTTKAKETMTEIFTVFIAGIREDYNRICEGKKQSLSNRDLDKLESHYQEILENIDKLNEKFPQIADAKYVSNTKEGIKYAREANEVVLRDFADINDEFPKILDFSEKIFEDPKEMKNVDKNAVIQKAREDNEKLKYFIQQERKKYGYSFQPTNKPNPQNTQQIQSLQKEINSLTQKLTELQNEINELKKQNTSSDQNTNPEIQQRIATLQNQKEQVQKTLKQKQSRQEKIEQQTNTQQPNNGFNWLYIAIPGAVLLVVMGVVAAYLVGKRSKNN